MSTQWDPISFTVKVKISYEEILIYIFTVNVKIWYEEILIYI